MDTVHNSGGLSAENSLGELLPDVSEKSTKAEIVKAYQTLVKKYDERVKGGKAEAVKKMSADAAVKKAGVYTVDALVSHMEEMKDKVVDALNALSQQLVAEAKKLEDIDRAIAVQQERLQALHDVEAEAIALEDLIKAQEEKKEAFEREYHKMYLAREQEAEEHRYQAARERTREAAMREEEEEVLRKRKEALMQQEEDMGESRKKVSAFPHELAEAVAQARKETADQVRKDMHMQAELATREAMGEKKVFETRIAFLQEAVARQNEEILSLKKELDQAAHQVQSIAEKAIEGSAGRQTLKAVREIAMQHARGSGSEE